jgi:hypothetical protein
MAPLVGMPLAGYNLRFAKKANWAVSPAHFFWLKRFLSVFIVSNWQGF